MLNDAKKTSNPEKQRAVFGLFGLLIPFNFFSVSGSYWVFLFVCLLFNRSTIEDTCNLTDKGDFSQTEFQIILFCSCFPADLMKLSSPASRGENPPQTGEWKQRRCSLPPGQGLGYQMDCCEHNRGSRLASGHCTSLWVCNCMSWGHRYKILNLPLPWDDRGNSAKTHSCTHTDTHSHSHMHTIKSPFHFLNKHQTSPRQWTESLQDPVTYWRPFLLLKKDFHSHQEKVNYSNLSFSPFPSLFPFRSFPK